MEISVQSIIVVVVGLGGIALVFKGQHDLAFSCFTMLIGAGFGYVYGFRKALKAS